MGKRWSKTEIRKAVDAARRGHSQRTAADLVGRSHMALRAKLRDDPNFGVRYRKARALYHDDVLARFTESGDPVAVLRYHSAVIQRDDDDAMETRLGVIRAIVGDDETDA